MAARANRKLVDQLKNGDRNGCAHLVDAYQQRLVGEAVEVFHVGREDAEELVSDTLLAVVRNIHTFEFKHGEGDFHAWVISIFRNKMRDFVRKQAITEGVQQFFDESELAAVEEYSAHEMQIVRAIVRQYEDANREPEDVDGNGVNMKLAVIADVLDRLETWERVLLRCRALDVPYEDIARYTGKPVSQLKVYHARVKKKFIQQLAGYFPELKGNETETTRPH